MQIHHPEETPDIPHADNCFCQTVYCRWHRFAAACVHKPNIRFANESPVQNHRMPCRFSVGLSADPVRKTAHCKARLPDNSAFLSEHLFCRLQSASVRPIKTGRRKQKMQSNPYRYAMKHVSFFFAPFRLMESYPHSKAHTLTHHTYVPL